MSNHCDPELNNQDLDSSSINQEPEWVKKKRLESVSTADETVEPRHKKHKKTKSNPQTSLDESITNLINLLDDEDSAPDEIDFSLRYQNFGQKLMTPKIIYCSRTHSQLAQVADELKKTDFFKDSNGKEILNLATSTASRNNLCINKDIRGKYKTSSAINEACNDLVATEEGCPYFNRHKEKVFKDHLDLISSKKILDIEDLFKFGHDSNCCPYYSSRYLVNPASLIITPYNTVLDKSAREAYGIELSDNIVIFDEAHNIVDFLKQMNSVQIQKAFEFFDQIIESIDAYSLKYGKRIGGSNASALAQLRIFFANVSKFLKEAPSGSYSVNDFIYQSKIDSFNFNRLVNHAEQTKLFTKVIVKIFLFELLNNFSLLLDSK